MSHHDDRHDGLLDDPFALFEDDDDPIEAYCVSCKDKTEMEDPQPVWTRKGTPGTRGYCAVCGTTVFRMGRTPAHDRLKKPESVSVSGPAKKSRVRGGHARKTPPAATYIAYAAADAALAAQLAGDLNNVGVNTWLPDLDDGQEDVPWASGVHPALAECTRMVVVLSEAALADEAVQQAWAFFKAERKLTTVAQVGQPDVPDDLRRAPRFDFSDGNDYRKALRQLVQALAE